MSDSKAMTIIYLQNQDLHGLSIKDLVEKYHKTYNEINKAEQDFQLSIPLEMATAMPRL